MLRPSLGSVPVKNVHIVVAEIGQLGRCLLRELTDTLNRIHLPRNLGENGRRIP